MTTQTRGAAKTDKFLLASCDLLIGEVGMLQDLSLETSIGLVKDLTLEFTPQYIDLQQGVQNQTVYSVRTGSDTRVTGSSYEYTDQNVAYAAGLNGNEVTPVVGNAYMATAVPSAGASENTTLFDVNTPTTPQTLQQGDYVLIHSPNYSQITKVVDVANLNTGELTLAGNFVGKVKVGAKITKVNVLNLGKSEPVTYVSAKCIGELPNGETFIIEIPKAQFTSGLSLAFTTNDFSNMALELKPSALLASEPGYDEFQGSLLRLALGNTK